MEISTLTIPKEEAREKYRELLTCSTETPLARTRKRVYHSLSKGKRIIDIYTAFEQAGLNELGHPRIAICRADAETCYFSRSHVWEGNNMVLNGGKFSGIISWRHRSKKEAVYMPSGLFANLTTHELETAVPTIPQEFMPRGALKNYYILWEVDNWKERIPRDPLLLRRLSKNLFEILAEWELTDLEYAIARGAF